MVSFYLKYANEVLFRLWITAQAYMLLFCVSVIAHVDSDIAYIMQYIQGSYIAL